MTLRPETIDPGRLHAIMAGSGYPYRVLTDQRKLLIRALHDGSSVSDLADSFQLTLDEVHSELSVLAQVSLLEMERGGFRPSFFVAGATEVDRVCEHAERVGRRLGGELCNRWPVLRELFEQLAIGKSRDFRSMAFLLVGDMILDIGLLNALACDGSLMPTAPARPDPDYANARYYFWMIEGDLDQLGRYGQRGTDLPWPEWQLITFGQYWIAGVYNQHRDDHDHEALEMATDGRAASPKELATQIDAPLITSRDARLWMHETQTHSDHLVTCYREEEASIYALFQTLRASAYAPYGFAEFFCWYDHVAYAAAIDRLAEVGAMTIPEERYVAAIWQTEGEGEFGV